MNARLKRVEFLAVFDAMMNLLKHEYGIDTFNSDMCLFIVGITRLKPIESLQISSEIKNGVSLFISCCNRYSKQKFVKLVENRYFQKLCQMFGDDNLKNQLETYSV